jgi:hypothetical protein
MFVNSGNGTYSFADGCLWWVLLDGQIADVEEGDGQRQIRKVSMKHDV